MQKDSTNIIILTYVNKLFSKVVDGYPGIPAPRPTQTHTYDFGCTFMGA